jgi:hypothetical protein
MNEPQRRPALRFRPEMADQYGIHPDLPDPPREVVKVDSLPDPPDVQAPNTVRAEQAQINLDEAVTNVLKQEFDELAMRLGRFGVSLTAAMQQELLDFSMALLGGMIGGGAISRRQ